MAYGLKIQESLLNNPKISKTQRGEFLCNKLELWLYPELIFFGPIRQSGEFPNLYLNPEAGNTLLTYRLFQLDKESESK